MNDMTQTPEMLIAAMAARARTACAQLALLGDADKARALELAAQALRDRSGAICRANAQDMENAAANGLSPAMLDRLRLDAGRVDATAAGVEQVAHLDNPLGQVIEETVRPNGLVLQRVRVPLGVIGIIYESRPNVTADAAALCLRAGNAAILRGGSEAVESNRAIHGAMVEGVQAAGLPADAIQLVPTTDRAAVGAMLRAAGLIDLIVPRGGKSLVARVQDEARVP
ncbi:MAG: aldehyde dehydrogenase family protein, partial [Sphingobium sp.]